MIKELNLKSKGLHYLEARASPNIAEISGNGWRHTVNLEKKECSCRRWQICGKPCTHALRFIFSKQAKLDDGDIPTIDATTTTTTPQLQGPLTRARARQLQQQVLSFLQATPNAYENMMLSKVDVFVSLRNDGPSMDERDKLWSMYVDGDSRRRGNKGEDDATNGDYNNLKPP